MDLRAAGLLEQPFPTHGTPSAIFSYAAEQMAMEALGETYLHTSGLCLFQGPPLSGKSTIIRNFINTLHEDCSVALIDGSGLETTELLHEILSEFGFRIKTDSRSELLGLIRVFALQQAAMHEPPLLIIENIHDINPSALHTLSELADLRVRTGSALKIVLVGERSLKATMRSPTMEKVSRRILHDFHLRPMTQEESRHFLYTKLAAAGSDRPDFVFPDKVCAALWKASGGWPGILDRIALMALANAETLPVSAEHVEHPALPSGTWDGAEITLVDQENSPASGAPQLIISDKGAVVARIDMAQPRLLIGRSEHNDIAIGSRFISRHHALLVRHGGSTFLMDLNSSNGTFVNSRRVSNQLLVHDDVITVGHHKIKFYDPNAQLRGSADGAEFTDTVIMKTLSDMRNVLARKNTEARPDATEELPTIKV